MIGRFGVVLAAAVMTMGAALADPIEGDWTTEKGSTARIAYCGAELCIKLKSGSHAGKKIGTFKANGGNNYSGKITDPENDKTYSGSATLSGSTLKMRGCVFGGLICKSQNWKKL